MRWTDYIAGDELRRAIDLLQAPGKVFEIRIIGTRGKKDIVSGYFRDADTLLRKLDTVDVRGKNIYMTIGEVKEECFARSQSERFEQNPATTSDPEIVRYRWLFVDLDPVRPAGISSSDAELKKAEQMRDAVLGYLAGIGFSKPVKAFSGNGYHLLYRIDLLNTEDNRKLVARCLKNLAAMFDSDAVKIDTTNANPSRICKVYGTLAQKGTSTEERPHRMATITDAPDPVTVTSMSAIEALAGELPDEPDPRQRRRGSTTASEFDLLDFMSRNGMTYTEDGNDRARIYRLDHCPFDHNHTNGDAKIFQYADGAIAFKCHHNSCRQYKWQDVRLKFEPDAYDHEDDDARIEAGYLQHLKQRVKSLEKDVKKAAQKKPFRKLKKAAELLEKDLPDPVVFWGVDEELPLLTEGTCLLSAKPKLGKSWLALGLCLAVANGEDFIGHKTRKCSALYLDLETGEALQQRRIRKALNGRPVPPNFYIDTQTLNLEDGFVDQIEKYLEEDPGIGLVVVDVFQIIRSPAKNFKETEYDHTYRDITPLNLLANKYHIAIILVCHDRKAVDSEDPFSNILGSTGLQGAASQMMVMFRSRKNEPIRIMMKAKTIDGLPEMSVELKEGQWSEVDGTNAADRQREEEDARYTTSDVRLAVIEIANHYDGWKGRCSKLINDAIELGVAVEATPKEVGSFLHRFQGKLLRNDYVQVTIIDNGNGPKIYRIRKSTIDTIDGFSVGFEESSVYAGLEIPFE